MDMTEHGSMDLHKEGAPPAGEPPKERDKPAIRPLLPAEGGNRRKRTGKDKFAHGALRVEEPEAHEPREERQDQEGRHGQEGRSGEERHEREGKQELKGEQGREDREERQGREDRGERQGRQEREERQGREDREDREERQGRKDSEKRQGRKGEREEEGEQAEQDEQAERKEPIPAEFDEWYVKVKDTFGMDASFDVQVREMTLGGVRTGLLFLSSFAKDASLMEILKRLTYLSPDSISHDALESFFSYYVPTVQIRKTDSFTEMVNDVLMGNAAIYVDGEPRALLLDAKQYPGRQPEQPELEKVVRGSKDGFTENILSNVGLIRRRLRDPKLRFEILKVGERTKTDVAIVYIDDIANTKLVEAVRDKIKAVKIDGIPLADKQLEEMTVKTSWNPFPLVRYSERPDVVASHLLDGSVTVLVDTSPSVMMLPTTYFDLIQHAEENRQSPFIGTYLRFVRFIGILISMFLLPLWYMYAESAYLRPHWLWFIGADKTGDLPLVVQFLLVEIGVDLMRLAAVHTPSPLVAAVSLVAAILVGDIAVKTGLFINEVILYMAVAAIGTFATPSYELGLANRIVRLVLLLAVFMFQLPGFVICSTLIFIGLVMVRSYNKPYMWPLIPFNGPALYNILLRRPLPKSRVRPSIYSAKQSDKQPS